MNAKKIKIALIVATILVIIAIVVIIKKTKTTGTITIPIKVYMPNKPTALPNGFTKNTKGELYTQNGILVKTYDPNTGAYQEINDKWHLYDGTPVWAYNTENGFYQKENDGKWYTIDGFELEYLQS
jgi:hypothetical protein